MESVDDLCGRAKAAILKQVNENQDKSMLIVAHGSILKAILTSITDGKVAYIPGKEIIEVGKLCLIEYKNDVFEIMAPIFNNKENEENN